MESPDKTLTPLEMRFFTDTVTGIIWADKGPYLGWVKLSLSTDVEDNLPVFSDSLDFEI